MNYVSEIKSLIEQELNIFCSSEKFLGRDGSYHFLYKTTNLINNKIYIGIKSTKTNPSVCKYLGSGIYKGHKKIAANPFGKSLIKKAFEKYGTDNFIREDLLFFMTREEAAQGERIVVNENFVKRKDNYNINIGGQIPPRKVGIENGNYGHKWSNEQKKKLSEYFKTNRNTVGSLNRNAKITYLYDCWLDEWIEFDCLKDICITFKWKYNTVESRCRKEIITAKRYLVTRQKLNKDEIIKIIDKSRFKKQIYDNSKKY